MLNKLFLSIMAGQTPAASGGGGGDPMPAAANVLDDTWWISTGTDTLVYDSVDIRWEPTVSNANNLVLSTIQTGTNANWSVREPPYRPDFIELGLVRGSTTGQALINVYNKNNQKIIDSISYTFSDATTENVQFISFTYVDTTGGNNELNSIGRIEVLTSASIPTGPYITKMVLHTL